MDKPTPNLKLLTAIRLKAWTQKELSEKSGISEAYISQMINGYRIPTDQQKRDIAAALSVQAGKVF